jgi:hypothetical protein
MLKIKQGNTASLKFYLTDVDGAAITDLSATTAIKFWIATPSTGVKFIEVLKTAMTIDSPSTGYLIVPLTAAQTATLVLPRYFFGLQLEYAGPKIIEVDSHVDNELTNVLVIEKQVVTT